MRIKNCYHEVEKISKTEQIHMRIGFQEKKIIMDYVYKRKISITDLFLESIFERIKNSEDLTAEEEKIIDEIERRKHFFIQQQKWKENNHNFYLIPNLWKTIYIVGRGYFHNSGRINMKIINYIIDDAIKQYRTFPKDIKNIMKDDIVELQKYRKIEYLKNKIRVLDAQPRLLK